MDESMSSRRTVEEWESHLGSQLRAIRLAADLSQARLAHLADVSTATIHNLEAGAGSSLKTLVKVVRALQVDSWLDQLAPREPPFDPVAELERRRSQPTRRRASARKDVS